MRVLALASYPRDAAATRYRLEQFVAPLNERGITLTIHPFLDSVLFERLYTRNSRVATAIGLMKSVLLRTGDLLAVRRADVILIQREAMILGPPLVEWAAARLWKRPMILDLDDATYISYISPTHGRLATALKWPRKTEYLIRQADLVICGNRAIAEYAASKGARTEIIPTVVDTDIFRPSPPSTSDSRITLGWIGTHSTFPYLESIFPVLEELAAKCDFRLKIVGAGKDNVRIPGVEVENLQWRLGREVQDFQSIDIGLYPIDATLYSDKWAAGKSGFKAIQYMAVGVPYVATPIGASAEIGEAGITHFFASSQEEWHDALKELILNAERRRQMGAAGRRHATRHFALGVQADKLAAALSDVVSAS